MILCVAAGWLLRDGVEKIIGKIRRGKKNNNAGSRVKGYRKEHGSDDSENRPVAEPNKQNGISEILDQAARNIERNKGNVFDLKEIWADAIEPVINISMELKTEIQKSGIDCSASIEAEGISKEGKQWSLYIGDYEKEEFYNKLERNEISNEIVQVSIKISFLLTFANIEKRKILGIKGMFYKPGGRITGKWKDNRYIMYGHGETEQSSRRGYDREGVHEMLEEQVKKAIEDW